MSPALAFAVLALSTAAEAAKARPRGEALLVQTWGSELNSAAAGTTPVTRVVGLLKHMQATLNKEMDEDASLHAKLGCWCNNNEYEKNSAITEEEAKIADLTSTIESLTAKVEELNIEIKQLNEDTATSKAALAEATELREKELKEFHGMEVEDVQNIENLKAAILVLSKHYGSALPQLTFAFLQGPEGPWAADHEAEGQHLLDNFMAEAGISTDADAAGVATQKFLQSSPSWRLDETATLKRALKSASAFMQARHGEFYQPAESDRNAAQSGEIMGVLKQLKEQMEGELSAAQKEEQARAAGFATLRASKQAEIEASEKQSEQKEDQEATAANDLAEAKEDLGQVQASLSENQKFAMNLKSTCADADKNFDERKNARLQEIKAVADTINILTADEARDVMSKTYNFLQVSVLSQEQHDRQRKASAVLRSAAMKSKNPDLSILATHVELDSFGRVKKAIDDMVAMLTVEQADEVKKNDWCKESIQANEMATAREENTKGDLSQKVDDLGASIERLADELATAKQQIAQLQVDLQRANENRKADNLDFQQTVADQRATVEVLHQALERLAEYYDQASFLQTKQTPPVPQMEYKPSAGSNGVISMIEKLIYEAKEMEAEARKGEVAAQAQYEGTVSGTFASIHTLQQTILTKTGEKAQAAKEKLETESDLEGSEGVLEDLAKTNTGLHHDCDYVLKNFDTRQQARMQEIEALHQAKQILSGASLA